MGDSSGPAMLGYDRLLQFPAVGILFGPVGLDAAATQTQPVSKLALWVVALNLGIFSWFKAEYGMVGLLLGLTPLLLVAQKCLGYDRRTLSGANPMIFSAFVDTIWGTTTVALFLIGVLSDWDPRLYAFSTIPFVGVLIVFVTLTHQSSRSFRSLDVEETVGPLSARVTVVLAIIIGTQTYAFGFPKSGIWSILTLGVTKAWTWYFMARTAQHSSWRTAGAAGIFSMVATIDPSIHSSDTQAFLHLVGSLIVLAQTIHIIPSHPKAKSALWFFSLVPIVPFVSNMLDIRTAQSLLIHSKNHPIEALVRNANANFETLLKNQSTTYTAAHHEYVRRYGIQPPPGFEAWFQYAKAHASPTIDDFNILYSAISPLWRLSGQEVMDAMGRAYNAPHSELWLCEFSGTTAQTSCRHPYRTRDRSIQLFFNTALGDLQGVFPDINIKFLVNHLDEPRVIVPPNSDSSTRVSGQFTLTNLSKQPVWDVLTRFCSTQINQAVQQHEGQEIKAEQPSTLPFITNHSTALDLCQHPDYKTMHGLLLSPTSLRLFEGLVPILSTGSLSTMGDILYPSPAYTEPEFTYSKDHDVDWDKKRNNLYWAGSTTGGYAVNEQWARFHRQRFVTLAQNLDKRRQHSYLTEDEDGGVSLARSSFLNSRLFDVAFTKVAQCEKWYCRAQRQYFRLKPRAHKDAALGSRLVFDTDGNGISGRFYKLLASNSAVLKQALLREWHDDRLVPWVHFVPVSQGMEELPELVSYLTSTENGQRVARKVGEQGREWFASALRDVDRNVYIYRLLLELARLQDSTRSALL
ncbi:glycosyltransferase family 90 protein [Aspergillus mulundensis]|uniref:Glycosyl transferase CAP10 domain-containing protein n=1 Tax=Aspergillus mulundensis TaxID=1810919 RepID=A0A3D8SJG3_9EURO|nr:Uncharacterized protein DSM5745_03109 [Aspergillus mulundensis]RDW86467.1 Uncharacterized protein DSM5745_03109 [Aspergillus mulundensis]